MFMVLRIPNMIEMTLQRKGIYMLYMQCYCFRQVFNLLRFVAFRLQRIMRLHRPECHGTSSQTYSLTKISNFEFSVETEEYRGEETDDHENDGEETESDQTDKEETRGIVTGGILSNFLCISGRIGPFHTL